MPLNRKDSILPRYAADKASLWSATGREKIGNEERTLSNVEGESSDTLLHQDTEVITAVGSDDTQTDGGGDDEGHTDGIEDPGDGADDVGINTEISLRLLSDSQLISTQRWLRKISFDMFGLRAEMGGRRASNCCKKKAGEVEKKGL